MQVILASQNACKIHEFQALCKGLPITIVPQSAQGVLDVEETGFTFVENAILKARHAAYHTGLPVFADDSGLCVYALDGDPGIYSARYAGVKASPDANIDKLLLALKNVPDTKRQAFFYCAIVFLNHAKDPAPLICTGKWQGTLLRTRRGEKGFGYDPIFYDVKYKKTAAELPLSLKNKISHRGIACKKLIGCLAEKLQLHDRY